MRKYVLHITGPLICACTLSANGVLGQTSSPPASILVVDTAHPKTLEQIIGLKPGVQLKSCNVVISSNGTIFKFEYGANNKNGSRLKEHIKNLHHNDVLFIENILFTEDGKTKKLPGQKAFTIQ